jgi:hypothetical protein
MQSFFTVYDRNSSDDDMEKRILEWLTTHKGEIVSSPRAGVFDRKAQDFEIVEIDEFH